MKQSYKKPSIEMVDFNCEERIASSDGTMGFYPPTGYLDFGETDDE